MALPNQINAAVPAGSDLPSTLDNRIRNLAGAVEDILGIPDQTNITNAMFGALAAGLQSVNFQDSSAHPVTAGHLQRRGVSLNWHDGTTSRGIVFDTATQTLTNKTLTSDTLTSCSINTSTVGAAPNDDLGIPSRAYVDENVAAGMMGFSNLIFSANSTSNTIAMAVLDKDGNTPSATRPLWVAFRHATSSNATIVRRQITSALTHTISNGSTHGFSANFGSRIYGVLCDNAGTVVLGSYHPFGSNNGGSSRNLVGLNEAALYNTTAEGGAGGADSAHTIYTPSALTNVAIRVVGALDVQTSSTAGQWSNPVSVNYTTGPGVPRTGDVVQRTLLVSSTPGSTALTIPIDSTPPQATEGAAVFATSNNITPTSAVNRLYHFYSATHDRSQSATTAVALFQDSILSALSVSIMNTAATTTPNPILLTHEMQTGTTAQMAFHIRYGSNAGTAYVNQNAAAANDGQLFIARHIIEEIQV